MKGSVKLPVFIDDARKYVNTTQLRAKYLGASYEAEYCQWQALHGLGSLMETASLIITPNAYLEGKLIASYPPDPIGDFDVTRATTATRVNSAGLVELVPYNLLTWSEDFTNGVWPSAGSGVSIVANSTAAPNGTTTADNFIPTAVSNFHYISQSFTYSAQTYTASVYAKSSGYSWFVIDGGLTNVFAYYNVSTGALGSVGSAATATITSVGNGWYRLDLTYTATVTSSAVFLSVRNANNGGQFTGDGTSGIYIWGAQLVEGSTAKDYQKTETRLNIPRLDYSNGTCPSLLVEPQRTNNLLYSSSFDNAAWDKQGATVTANDTTAPDGTLTADKVVFSGANKTIRQALNMAGATITASVYIKGTAGQTIGIDDIFATQQIVTLTGEWQRLQFTAASPNGYGLGISTFGGVTATTIWVWGAQLEAGSYSTSYIPTQGASVTRNADVISKTGISSLIGQTEGTMFVDFYKTHTYDASAELLAILYDSANPLLNRVQIVFIENTIEIYATDGTLVVYSGPITSVSNGRHKIAVTYGADGYKVYLDGTSIYTNAATWSPVMNSFRLGSFPTNVVFFSDGTNATALWPTSLSNTELTALTTL